MAEFQKRGFQRVKIDGEFYEIADAPALDKKFKHDIDVVVDRIVVRPDIAARLAESFETALELADGIAVDASWPTRRTTKGEPKRELIFSSEIRLPGLRLHHPRDRAAAVLVQQPLRRLPGLRRPRPRDGVRRRAGRAGRDEDPARGRHRALGAGPPRPITARPWRRWARHYGFKLDDAVAGPAAKRRATSSCTAPARRRSASSMTTACAPTRSTSPSRASSPNLERRWKETDSDWVREEIGRFMSETPCEACDGYRLKPEALAVKIAGRHIGEVAAAVGARGPGAGSPSWPASSTPSRWRSPGGS